MTKSPTPHQPTQGNRWIATYIGMKQKTKKYASDPDLIYNEFIYSTRNTDIKVPGHTMANGEVMNLNHHSYGPPEFHLDWNWLMYAVDYLTTRNESLKLGLNGTNARIYTSDLDTYQTMTLTQAKEPTIIESVWSVVIEFIKEYDRPG